jgi:choline-sulfatase
MTGNIGTPGRPKAMVPLTPQGGPVARVGLLLLLLALMSSLLLTSCQQESIPEHPNFVIIVSDALRPDHLGCYGYYRPTSPNIDALAAGGIRFDTAITNAPWTKGSFSSMFTSMHLFQHGVTDWISKLPDTLEVLPEVLAGEGYNTMCVMNMVGMEGRYGVLRGFTQTSVTGKEDRDAAATTDDVIDLITASHEPFLLLVHYFDTHRPYEPPDRFMQAIAGEEDLTDMQLYDACIRYVDTEVGRIIETLDQAGARERTVVIVTADHGDAFMEHGTRGHGRTLFDEELRSPLVLSYPSRYSAPGTVANQVRMIDLAPSLLELAHTPIPESWDGASFVGLIEGAERAETGRRAIPPTIALTETSMRRGVLPVKSVRTMDWKIIVEPATGLVQAFDLKSDPGEAVNLWPARPGPDAELAKTLWSVPGATLSGWRLGFTGDIEGTTFRTSIEVPEGGRINEIERSASKGRFIIRADKNGRELRIESTPEGLNLLIFETEPEDAEVAFTFADDLGSISAVYVGADGVRATGKPLSLSRSDAHGLPQAFDEHRRSDLPGAFVWWLPGGRPGGSGEAVELSPDEQKRLKALGYIQ